MGIILYLPLDAMWEHLEQQHGWIRDAYDERRGWGVSQETSRRGGGKRAAA